jgi:hypothetical protein
MASAWMSPAKRGRVLEAVMTGLDGLQFSFQKHSVGAGEFLKDGIPSLDRCLSSTHNQIKLIHEHTFHHHTAAAIRSDAAPRPDNSYEYFTLNRTVRTAKGPRQEIGAHLGKDFEPPVGADHGWDDIDSLLEGKAAKSQNGNTTQADPSSELFAPKLRTELSPLWMQVDLSGLRIERTREFGQVYLGLALWRRLGLHTALKEIVEPGRETVPWDITACILTIARFCGNKSELEVAEQIVRWKICSA